MKAEMEALERIRVANPVPDDELLDGHDLRSLFATVEERRSSMSTGMRERTRAEEQGPRRRVVAVVVFAATMLLVILGVGSVPLFIGNEDEIVPVEQTTTTLQQTTTTVIEPVVGASLFEWSDPVVIPWLSTAAPWEDGGIEVVEGPAGYLAVVGPRQLVRSANGEWSWRENLAASPDGIAWSPVIGLLGDSFASITGTDEGFLAFGLQRVHISENGRTWSRVEAPVSGGSLVIAHGPAGFVVADTRWGYVAHSPDGRDWSLLPEGTEESSESLPPPAAAHLVDGDLHAIVKDVTYGPAGYVAVAETGKLPPDSWWPVLDQPFSSIWLSPDGRSWERVETTGVFDDPDSDLSGVAYGPGGYVAVGFLGGGVWVSQDGRDWQKVSSEHMGSELAAGDAGYLARSASHVWYSPDGIDWRTLGPDDMPDEGRVTGVSVLGDRLLLRGSVDVDGGRTHALWWGTVND